MSVDIAFLIKDEKEAIEGYKDYLAQGVPKAHIPVVKRIIAEEQKHIRQLRKLK